MLIDLNALEKRSQENKEPSEWRNFKLSNQQKCRVKIKGIRSTGYRVAQERITERLRLTCHDLRYVQDFEETAMFQHMTAVAYHLLEDWEGLYSKETGSDIPFTPENAATLLKYSGDLGILLNGFILEEAAAIQAAYDKEIDQTVGKPWSISDSMQKASEGKKCNESENASENQK